MPLKLGSLFAGYGGFDLAVEQVFPGTETVWVSDIEPGPSKILAHHYPHAPNLGDVTKTDWESVEPVDILVGGSPCQDLSSAGQRRGMKPGTRSGLWESMMQAVKVLRPSMVVWENVRGALSAEAFSLMESGPGRVGGGSDGPVLRALGRVLGDLSNTGYDAEWRTVRASDIGAPHRRERVFVVAYPAIRGLTWARDRRKPQPRNDSFESNNPLLPTPIVSDSSSGRTVPSPDFIQLRDIPKLLPTPTAGQGGSLRTSDGYNDLGRTVRTLLPTPVACTRTRTPEELARRYSPDSDRKLYSANLDEVVAMPNRFGRYVAAVRRWEQVMQRSAPDPALLRDEGPLLLNPAFVEWMMGLPEGWVTDVGLSRAQQLRALGNGIVPQQGAHAISLMLTSLDQEAAA